MGRNSHKLDVKNILNDGRDGALGEAGVWRWYTRQKVKDEGCLNEEILWAEAKLLLFEFVLNFAPKPI